MRAFSVVNIHLMRALAALRWRCHAAFADKALQIVNSAVQALAAQDADLDLHHVEPACVLGGPQNAAGFGGAPKSGVEQARWGLPGAVASDHKTLAASNKREPPAVGKPVLASPRESGTSPSPPASGTSSV